ncbi:TetR/AcrR family transcriptional regulator [Frateuria aurantia]
MPPASTSTSKAYHHGDLRRGLLEAALSMLEEQRDWQFTLREVARRAVVSHSAPYRHFHDKADLLHELCLIGFDRLLEVLARADLPAAPAPRRLWALAFAYLHFGLHSPGLYQLMFAAEASDPVRLHADPRAIAPFQQVIAILEQGQREGSIRVYPARGQATACWAQLHGLTTLSLGGHLLPTKVGEHAFEAALASLLAGLTTADFTESTAGWPSAGNTI